MERIRIEEATSSRSCSRRRPAGGRLRLHRQAASAPGRLRPKPRTGGSGVGGRWRPAARRTGAAPWRRRGRRGCGRWCSAGEGRWPAAWRMGGTRPRGDMTGGAAAGHGSGATGATARKLVACVGVKMRREAAAGWLRGFRFRNFRFLFFFIMHLLYSRRLQDQKLGRPP